jgi:hypothetical protein
MSSSPSIVHVNPENVKTLQDLCMNHVSSLDWAMTEGLQLARESLQVDIQLPKTCGGTLTAGCNGARVPSFDRIRCAQTRQAKIFMSSTR